MLPLDVTSKESIEKCKAQLKTNGIDGLDVLVNNAGGIAGGGPILDMNIEESKKMFDVNVWGLLAVTQAFAPLLMDRKGCILNICSVAGALKLAWQGGYNASKAAATFLSETLRIEVEPLGLRVVTAMVGEVQSQIWQQGDSYKLPEGSYYKSVERFIVDQMEGKKQAKEEPAETVAKSLVDDVLSGMSGQTWRGGQAGAAKNALRFVPSKLFVSRNPSRCVNPRYPDPFILCCRNVSCIKTVVSTKSQLQHRSRIVCESDCMMVQAKVSRKRRNGIIHTIRLHTNRLAADWGIPIQSLAYNQLLRHFVVDSASRGD